MSENQAAEHTPGPWHMYEHEAQTTADSVPSHANIIGPPMIMWRGGWGFQNPADARLASSSPELKDLLMEARAIIDHLTGTFGRPTPKEDIPDFDKKLKGFQEDTTRVLRFIYSE